MTTTLDAKKVWEQYCQQEIAILTPLLQKHNIALDTLQPHISGERFLMHAVTTTSGKKLILLGTHGGKKVVIKVAKDAGGIKEIEHDRLCRSVLNEIDFAGETFNTPSEVAYIKEQGYVVAVQLFIEQDCSFLERPLQEQFMFALQAFKGQESAHATTFTHRRRIAHTFGIRDAQTYLQMFENFIKNLTQALPEDTQLIEHLEKARLVLQKNKTTIEQYCGFLTHTDFVPHNIRISGNTMYLLDYSSLTFGNKYEGWARFLNFMTLYNQPLEEALVTYVKNNRTPEESIALRMMRIYRLGEIIWYYVRTLDKSSDNLLQLNIARIHFWRDVLSYVLEEKEVPKEVIVSYTTTRDRLRSEDEKLRQKGLH